MHEQKVDTFENHMGKEDYGLVIDSEGNLKGLFIPEGFENMDVRPAIVKLCIQFFGIDPTEDHKPYLH